MKKEELREKSRRVNQEAKEFNERTEIILKEARRLFHFLPPPKK